jgi:hypothetical protein
MLRTIIKRFSKIDIVKQGDIRGKKFTKEEVEKYLDPFGFLDTNEYDEAKNKVESKVELSKKEKEQSDISKKLEEISKIEDPKLKADMIEKNLPKEYGFKYNGPEPTKFGDWNIKGKCSDF